MPKLTCQCNCCMHNKNNNCCRPSITVKGEEATCKSDTFCHSFSPTGEGALNVTAFCTENVDIDVSCNAKNCVHKSGNVCTAQDVNITNSTATTMKNTVCSSFCNN